MSPPIGVPHPACGTPSSWMPVWRLPTPGSRARQSNTAVLTVTFCDNGGLYHDRLVYEGSVSLPKDPHLLLGGNGLLSGPLREFRDQHPARRGTPWLRRTCHRACYGTSGHNSYRIFSGRIGLPMCYPGLNRPDGPTLKSPSLGPKRCFVVQTGAATDCGGRCHLWGNLFQFFNLTYVSDE